MPIRSRAAAAAVHILTALCAAVGVVLQCGFIGGKLNLAVLQYFTLMSNILCAVYFTGAAVHTLRRGGTWLPVCKGALVMAMAITGITFHLVLAAGDFSMGPTQLITNHLLHTAAPLLRCWIGCCSTKRAGTAGLSRSCGAFSRRRTLYTP